MKTFIKRRWRPLLAALFFVLLSAWILLSPRFSPGLYDKDLFHPEYLRGSEKELRNYKTFANQQSNFKAADGSELRGWLFLNPAATKLILFHPGNAGDIPGRLEIIDLLLRSGASVFIYEPRGFGLSTVKPEPASFLSDGISAYEHLRNLGYGKEQLVLYGESLGCTVATHVASLKESAGLILQSGFYSLERIGKERYWLLNIYPAFLFPEVRMDNSALLKRAHPPLLLVHGQKDELIPLQHSEALFQIAGARAEFLRLPNSGHIHFAGEDRRVFQEKLAAFLRSLP
ncbi:MAG: alpha/beta fold hydrolase [Candidatus Obscuribacterales bacterium]|nr:alpha/beta fold hydrolase [Candidatus Obscuribacterales bacterium]